MNILLKFRMVVLLQIWAARVPFQTNGHMSINSVSVSNVSTNDVSISSVANRKGDHDDFATELK